jgi:hypothetical protein
MKVFRQYYLPTPAKWRKIGDALLAAAGLIGGGGLLAFDQLKEIFDARELKLIIGGVLVLGIAGKFLTNFFGPEKSNSSDNNGAAQ